MGDQDGWICHVLRRGAETMILPDQPWWSCPMALTIARQVVSQSRQALTHDFISAESSLSHSVAHALHASAHARQAWTMSGLWLAIRSAGRSQNLAQSATRCRALAYSFFPAATCV